MRLTLNIQGASEPETKAFLDYLHSLKFVVIEQEDNGLNQNQLAAIEEARASYQSKGGQSNEEVINKMKSKYPNAFDL